MAIRLKSPKNPRDNTPNTKDSIPNALLAFFMINRPPHTIEVTLKMGNTNTAAIARSEGKSYRKEFLLIKYKKCAFDGSKHQLQLSYGLADQDQ